MPNESYRAPSKQVRNKHVSFRLNTEEMELIDWAAQALKQSRSRFIIEQALLEASKMRVKLDKRPKRDKKV